MVADVAPAAGGGEDGGGGLPLHVGVLDADHAQLAGLGVTDRQASPFCTLESGDHFSYRRDRTTGRLAGYVWLD